MVVPFVATQDTAAKINEVWFDGMWNFHHLYIVLPEDVVTTISSIQPRIAQNLPDVWTWSNSSTSLFTVKDV
jgi:hypothetical protein